ncbi:MAG: DUF1178 family protein [Pseudomonadota bacterium]
MIKYALKCSNGHEFESWFRSSADYDALVAAGHLTCSVCGVRSVEKALMTPGVAAPDPDPDRDREPRPGPAHPAGRNGIMPPMPAPPPNAGGAGGAGQMPARPLSAPASPAEQALAELRQRIEAQAENVGQDFAAEARRIHDGEAPGRPIYGEASLAEARQLAEDDIPVVPLPWRNRKSS